MTPRVGFQSFLATTLDYRESEPLEPSYLESLVSRLRAGDRTVGATIIKGHYRLVAAIVGSTVRSKRRHDDCLGAALLALAEAVDAAAPQPPDDTVPGALYDNNITYYITALVKFAIYDEMAASHLVRMPARTVRLRLSEGKALADFIPRDPIAIAEDVQFGEHSQSGNGKTYALPFHIPASKPLCESPEFKEALARAVQNPTQQAIVTLRAQGYSYKEVGERVGMSTPRVGQIMAEIEPRFDEYFRG